MFPFLRLFYNIRFREPLTITHAGHDITAPTKFPLDVVVTVVTDWAWLLPDLHGTICDPESSSDCARPRIVSTVATCGDSKVWSLSYQALTGTQEKFHVLHHRKLDRVEKRWYRIRPIVWKSTYSKAKHTFILLVMNLRCLAVSRGNFWHGFSEAKLVTDAAQHLHIGGLRNLTRHTTYSDIHRNQGK